MKNIKLIFIALIGLSLLTGCDTDFEELNTDPNNPVALPADLLLGYAQRQQMNSVYGMQRGGGDMGSCWAQQMAKVQYNTECIYIPRRGVIDAIWNNQYTLVVAEAKAMAALAEADGNTNLQAVGLIMQAIGFQTLADLYGPIPFTEAIDGAILKPAYDDEATVYAGILQLLTDAADLLSGGTGSIVATSDLYYGGDTSKWLKLANSLKFRALMRISSTRSVGAELQALVNDGNMMSSNEDSAQIVYLGAAPDANPIYETIVDGGRPEYKIGSKMVEILEVANDPRLQVYAEPAESDGVIRGKPAGYGADTTLPNEALGLTYANISGLGNFYLDPTLPGVLLSYAQLNFLWAEAANEGLISGGIDAALNFYKQGIASNFAFNGLDATNFLSGENIAFANQADAREKIATQEWIALYCQGFEAWAEVRRTGFPELEPAIEAPSEFTSIPGRLYYPTTESSLNSDNYDAAVSMIGGDELTSTLFWQ